MVEPTKEVSAKESTSSHQAVNSIGLSMAGFTGGIKIYGEPGATNGPRSQQRTDDANMKQHFVTFLSPGTFFSEQSTKPIESWDVDRAVAMSKKIVERYNAKPYGFQFTTRERGPKDLDSKETKRSGTYFLGGRVMTLADVKREMPDERILISNMEGNGYDKVVVSATPWKSIHPLEKGDHHLP